jgi:hypothetical protein
MHVKNMMENTFLNPEFKNLFEEEDKANENDIPSTANGEDNKADNVGLPDGGTDSLS